MTPAELKKATKVQNEMMKRVNALVKKDKEQTKVMEDLALRLKRQDAKLEELKKKTIEVNANAKAINAKAKAENEKSRAENDRIRKLLGKKKR